MLTLFDEPKEEEAEESPPASGFAPRLYQTEAVAAFWASLCERPSATPVIVLPTGAGKSIVIAMIARTAVQEFGGRVVVLAHRKELLEQNAEKLQAAGLEVGIYSAGLNRRDAEADVLVAGIQSVYRRAHEIGARNLVFVDEVHLVADDGMYRTFVQDLTKYNPRLRLGGCTATPFRLDVGPICGPDRVFSRVCYSAPVRELIEKGYLSRIVTKSEAGFDTSGLHIRGGEFVANEVEVLFGGDDLKVEAACREIVARTKGRRSVLVFCSGVRHAEKVSTYITRISGDVCGLVVGEMDALSRAATLAEFKSGRMKYVANVDVLTTGFDFPGIDAIAILRATMSPGLLAQMVGRGLRRAPGKDDALVLDFGQNFSRHGPIDSPEFGCESPGDTPGQAPAKMCPNCGNEVSLGALECKECGFAFQTTRGEAKHDEAPDDGAQALLEPETWDVVGWSFARHVKKKDPEAPNTLRVEYLCKRGGGNLTESISEWVCLLHSGFAGKKAARWWSEHTREPFVPDIDEAIYLFDRGAFAQPTKITTQREGHFYRIVSRELPAAVVLLGDAAEPEGDVADVVDEWSDVPF